MKRNSFFLTIAAIFTVSSLVAQPILVDKVIAVIGDKVILHSQLEEQYQYQESQAGVLPEGARCLLADQLITQKIFLLQADIDSMVVEVEEVDGQLDARIDQILRYMNGSEDQFVEYYGKTPPEVKEDMRADMEDQLIVQRMQGSVVEKVTVTPAEVKAFFRRVPKDSLPYFNSEVEMAEIVIMPKVNKEELKKAYDKLEKFRQQIVEEGADFGELARIYSDDPGSASRNGDLGWVRRGEMVPEFEAATFRLKAGEMSSIVKTEYGYHLIQSIERRGNTVNARHILVKPELTEADKMKASNLLDSIRNVLVTDTLSFTRAVKKFSEDDMSKNNAGLLVNPQTGTGTFEIGELPVEIFMAISDSNVGDISAPVEFLNSKQEPAYRIVKLLSKTEPHEANLRDDYAKIQNAALEGKKQEYMEKWVVEKVAKMYIHIDDTYSQCPNLTKWTAASASN